MNTSNHIRQAEAQPSLPADPESRWKDILMFIGAGVLAATQIGKAHIALPDIEAHLSQGLARASWIISALSLMAMLSAVPAGVIASKFGAKRAVVSGLLVLGVCSFAGSFSRNESELLLSRVGEGAGYLAVIVAAPSLIAVIAPQKDHLIALGGWGAFLPAGVALASLLGPYAMLNGGWRSLWLWSALALIVFALVVQLWTAEPSNRDRSSSDSVARSFEVYRNRSILLLAGIFGFYTLEHLGIMSLFPSYLMNVLGASPTQTGLLNSVAMAFNISGNVAAGFLLRQGSRMFILIPGALLVMAVSAWLVFESRSVTIAFAGASIFCAVGGAVPGTVLALLPSYCKSTGALAPGNGLLVQGSNLGILVGPILVSALVSKHGWSWAPLISLASLVGGITLVFVLSHRSNRTL